MKRKTRLVLWSGGIDSSYLIYKSVTDGYEVHTAYIEFKNNEQKTVRETKAMDAMREHFSRFGVIDHGTVLSADVHSTFDYHRIGCTFSFPMIPSIFNLMCLAIGRFNEIAIGYVMNDDVIPYIKHLKKLFKIANKFRSDTSTNKTKLVFPLYKTSKYDIVAESPNWILDNYTCCENGDVIETRFCDTCLPCRRAQLYRHSTVLSTSNDDVIVGEPVEDISQWHEMHDYD